MKLPAKAFTQMDTKALNIQRHHGRHLAGSAQEERPEVIYRTILSGITTGKSAEHIVRNMGRV